MESAPFFPRYKSLFGSIEGMFSFEAALMMTAYAQLAAEEGVRQDTLEIGVHHGLSAILVAALRANAGRFTAVDLFEGMQDHNLSHSGSGSKNRFLSNMAGFYGDNLEFMRAIAAPSSSLKAADLGQTYSFCHVDGGHSADETAGDLKLASEILIPQGILVLDDYFNPAYPGVSEGAVRFMQKNDSLTPVALGCNKVVFEKKPRKRLFSREKRLNDSFVSRFPELQHSTAEMFGETVFHFGLGLSSWVDLQKSSPHQLVLQESVSMRVNLEAKVTTVSGRPGEVLSLPVHVENVSDITFGFGEQAIGLTYHLKEGTGQMVAFDNRRQYFHDPLPPGQHRVVNVPVLVPESAGKYLLEFDLVWEGICWFKDRGNESPVVTLQVL